MTNRTRGSSNTTRAKKLWDPVSLFDIVDSSYGFTCVGYAPSKGRRCHMRINQGNREFVLEKLENLAYIPPRNASVTKELKIIARTALCLNFHRDQVDDVHEQWLSLIKKKYPRKPKPKQKKKPRRPVYEDPVSESETESSSEEDEESETHSESESETETSDEHESDDDDEIQRLQEEVKALLKRLQEYERRKSLGSQKGAKMRQRETRQRQEQEEETKRRAAEAAEEERRRVEEEERRRAEEEQREVRRRAEEERRKEAKRQEEMRQKKRKEEEERRQKEKERREREQREKAENEKAAWEQLWANYQQRWDDFKKNPPMVGRVTDGIPWPVRSGLLKDVVASKVEEFMEKAVPAGQRKKEILKWHEDKIRSWPRSHELTPADRMVLGMICRVLTEMLNRASARASGLSD